VSELAVGLSDLQEYNYWLATSKEGSRWRRAQMEAIRRRADEATARNRAEATKEASPPGGQDS